METEIIKLEDECNGVVKRSFKNKIKHLLSDVKSFFIKTKKQVSEHIGLQGAYTAVCIGADGKVKWEDTIKNVVTTLGKDALLNAGVSGSNYTATCYMGLISSVGYGGGALVGDTMTSHTGWVEAGFASNFPLYTVPRKTCVWSASSAGVKALSASLSFVCETTGGTVKGCFIVFGTGAVATINDTNGVLLSAGVFTAGDKTIGVGDTLQVSYNITS